MIERREHRRVEVNYWASLKHPLLGTMTGSVRDLSLSGLAIKLDEDVNFFVMMELDVHIHGDGWDDTMPALIVQVVRVNQREVALRFIDESEESYGLASEQDFGFTLAETDDIQLRA
jgi:hypothetical protein